MTTQRKTKVTSLDEIKAVVSQHRPILKHLFHVDEIGVFGSYARGEHKKSSDVDFLVTFDRDISLFDHANLNIYLQEATGRKVDVVIRGNLRPELSKYVLMDVIYL